jgi:PAS domain S-box-containing protein
MSVLVITPTAEAATRLSSALARRGMAHQWSTEFSDNIEPPLVAVVDSEISSHAEILTQLRNAAPWCRCVLMTSDGVPRSDAATPQPPATRWIAKPFDAAALAEELLREAEIARMAKQERLLITQAQDLEALVKSSFEAIIGLDVQQRVTLWNPGAENLYGYSAAYMLGRPISTLAALPETWPSLGLGAKHVAQLKRKHQCGKLIDVLVSRSRFDSRNLDSSVAYSEVSLDVTARVQMEVELEHSLRLAHLGRLAATMSHEINNPLSVILSCVDWLGAHADAIPSPELKEILSDLTLASQRISSYVAQMTGFVRRQPTTHVPVDFASTLDCALRLVRPRAARAKVVLSLESGSWMPPVPHDSARISHALVNLLSNAIDAAKHGGHTVVVQVELLGDHLHVMIQDDGPGVDPEIASHLFEPFSTTKPWGEGTGLGLALTREIMVEHKGSVTLENNSARGAKAVLRLPLYPNHLTGMGQ